MFITLGEVSTPSAGMIIVITLAAILTVVSLTLRFALLWSAWRELRRDADELDEWFHSDALFGFAIAAHLDRVVRMGRIERDVVLN